MESEVIQRIKHVIELKGMSVTALSKNLGIVQQTLNRQISGDSAMSLLTIDKFLSCFPDVSSEWLLRGHRHAQSPKEDKRTANIHETV